MYGPVVRLWLWFSHEVPRLPRLGVALDWTRCIAWGQRHRARCSVRSTYEAGRLTMEVTRRFTVNFPLGMFRRLEALAKAHRRSVSAEVLMATERHLAEAALPEWQAKRWEEFTKDLDLPTEGGAA